MSKHYDISYSTRPEFQLEVLSKNEDGEKEIELYEPPFPPYCYISDDVSNASRIMNYIESEGLETDHDSPDGYIKVEGDVPWDIRNFRYWAEDNDVEVFEADVPYARRVMIDEGIQLDPPDMEDVLYFDIEVDPRGEFPDAEEAKKQVISIAAVDGVGNEYFLCYDDEEQILEEFVDLLDDYFVISGWNSAGFDWPYIKNRCQHKSIWIDTKEIVHLDLMHLMRHINREERQSWALDVVGQDEVGMGKAKSEEDYDEGWEILWQWYEDDRDTLYEYNIEDCRITAAIDEKYRLINLLFRICARGYCRASNIMYQDDSGGWNIAVGKAADSTVLKLAHELGRVQPIRGRFTDVDVPGGKVFDPVPGVWDDVMTADFSGMYPAMIRDFNIGPSTWIDAGSLDQAVSIARDRWGDDITEDDIIMGPGAAEIDADPEAARGYFIDPEIHKSILAMAVDELEDLRMEFKDQKKAVSKGSEEWHKFNNIDRGLKVLMNTLFGIAASRLHRYYIPGMSENITETGQHLISECFDWASDNLPEVNQVLYGDSVTGDTVTPIMDSDGNIELHRFNELLSEYEFEELGGYKDRYRPSGELYTLTRDGWNQIRQLVGHEVDKDVYICRTPRGVFSVTEDHSVVGLDGEFSVTEWTDGQLCSDVDQMPLMSHTDIHPDMISEIDVYDYIKPALEAYRETTAWIDITVNEEVIRARWRYKNEQSTPESEDVGDVYREIDIPRYITLDDTFGFVIGAFIGDGSTTEHGGAKLSVSQDDVRERFLSVFTDVFGRDLITDGVNLSFANKLLSELFKSLCGRSSDTKQLPDWYLHAPEEFLLGALRGYAYTDSPKKYRTEDVFEYASYGHCGSQSRKLVSQVYFAVTNLFGVDQQCVEVGYRHEKDQYWITWDSTRKKYSDGFHHRALVRKKQIDCNYVWDLTVDDDHTFTDALGGTVLHNTDSVMFQLNVEEAEFTQEEFDEYVATFIEEVKSEGDDKLDMDVDELREAYKIITVARQASSEINDFIVDFVKDVHNSPGLYMEMDLDDVWRNYLITTKKKKYAGEVVYDDGPCAYRKIKGFKCVKANTSDAIVEFQKKLIEAKLHRKDTNHIIRSYHDDLFHGKFDYQMVQHTKLGSMPDEYKVLPSHGRAAQKIIEREDDENAVRTGDKIAYLKYGSDPEQVMPVDNGIDDWRPNENYCHECDDVIWENGCGHETEDYPHLRRQYYSYLWDARFIPTLNLLGERTFEQTSMEAFV